MRFVENNQLIFTKFHQDWTKNVDFLRANFLRCLVFSSSDFISYVVSNFWQSNRIKAGIHGRECNTLKVITNKFTKISFDAAIFGNELQPSRRKVMRTAVEVVLCTIH